MKVRESLILVLIISLSMVPILSQTAVHSQSEAQYTERIDVYTSSTNAYTIITMNQLNGTNSKLTAMESTSGLQGYRLIALSTQNEKPDYQIFGVDGYNLFGVASIPTSGVFLDVNATSSSAASAAASYFDSFLGTNLTLLSSNGDQYSYSAPVDYSTVAVPALYSLIPTTKGGFASIFTESGASSAALPSVALTGESGGANGVFTHTISVGEAFAGVISSSGALDFSTAVGGASAMASSSAASSTVVVHSLDGLVASTDKNSTISNAAEGLSGNYTLLATAGKTVAPNVTISSQTPTLNAYRTVSLTFSGGSEYVGVTVFVSNTAENSTTGQDVVAQNVTIDDNWWLSMPNLFQLAKPQSTSTTSTTTSTSSGNDYEMNYTSIGGGRNETFAYSLQVLTKTPMEVVIPAGRADYSYSLAGKAFNEYATLNEVDLQLNNNTEPGISAYVQPDYADLSGSPVGANATLVVTVTNQGYATATNVNVAGHSISALPSGTTYPPFKVPVSFTSLLQRSFSANYSVSWTTPAQQTENITANSVSLLFARSDMGIPMIRETAVPSPTTSHSELAKTLNVTYTFSNEGTADSGAVTGTETFPSGVSCKVVSGTGATCGSGTVSFDLTRTEAGANQSVILELQFGEDNYIIPPPASLTATYEGGVLHGSGSSYVVLGAIEISKTFSPSVAFPGMPLTVALDITNHGSQTLSNVTVSSSADDFDTVSSTAQKTFETLAAGASQSFTYTVKVSQGVSGNLTGAEPTATMLIGGGLQSVTFGNASLLVYKPITASATASPSSPSDGHNFEISFVITNPAPVALSDIQFSWKLPSGVVEVSGPPSSGGVVTQTYPSLAANSSQDIVLTLRSNIGLTLDTGVDSHLTFTYQNSTITGVVKSLQVTVGEDVTTAYVIPIAIAVVLAVAALFLMRRSVAPVVVPDASRPT